MCRLSTPKLYLCQGEKLNFKALKFGDMPIYMGCIDQNIDCSSDIFWPMEWGIKDNSLFGVLNPPSPKEIYKFQHNDSVGEIWNKHHSEFARFISSEYRKGNILEIGSATGKLNRLFYGIHERFDSIWDAIEPNPIGQEELIGGGRFIDGWFPSDCDGSDYDTIVHSHVIEHLEDPINFLKEINRKLKMGGKLIFSWPNMREMLNNKDLNVLMFEHLNYLSSEEMTSLLNHTGFSLDVSESYVNHSLFLSATKIRESEIRQRYQSVITNEELELFNRNYGTGLLKIVAEFNQTLKNSKYKNYVFGAHIFSQYLFANGLDVKLLSGLLDNSDTKNNKRIYGWPISVQKPENLFFTNKEPITILLPMGAYEDEIINQIKPKLPSGSLIHGIRSGILCF